MTPEAPELLLKWDASPDELDKLWANGWRRCCSIFYRYDSVLREGVPVAVQPLRVPIEKFQPTKSQRRVQRRNADLTLKVGMACIDDTRRQLFDAHKQRFRQNPPTSLEYYLGWEAADGPCETVELALYAGERLVAASYLDLGLTAASGVYAMFDLKESRRSLGIYTMLLEIDYAKKRGCQFYYHGYGLPAPSPYDYKKRIRGTEWFDWEGNWLPLK